MKKIIILFLILIGFSSLAIAKDRTGKFLCQNIQAFDLTANGQTESMARDNLTTLFEITRNSVKRTYDPGGLDFVSGDYTGYFSKTKNNQFLPDGTDIFHIDERSQKSDLSPDYIAWNSFGLHTFTNQGYGKVRVYLYECLSL